MDPRNRKQHRQPRAEVRMVAVHRAAAPSGGRQIRQGASRSDPPGGRIRLAIAALRCRPYDCGKPPTQPDGRCSSSLDPVANGPISGAVCVCSSPQLITPGLRELTPQPVQDRRVEGCLEGICPGAPPYALLPGHAPPQAGFDWFAGRVMWQPAPVRCQCGTYAAASFGLMPDPCACANVNRISLLKTPWLEVLTGSRTARTRPGVSNRDTRPERLG